ncbi:MAG: flagellar hook assembly protein FlgD [Alphaproteobacteria bacterium]|nr:MAG: flagellar hook assembly protein FlgD [Alphaproteobacteria bacterium]TAF14805.1 MAG: flagellar hook assembly protein FlgD [Alphaproteobacteria bacterium]TAF38488.1 MAG: flagellar hook assembly protein FlgD [Alphaproteobacteria bacterium]
MAYVGCQYTGITKEIEGIIMTTSTIDAIARNQTASSTMDAVKKTAAEDKPKSEISAKKLADDFDAFLLLLTTQLKNQDPTEPLDTNEFTSQLIQFANVEQQVQTNANIEKLVAATQSAGIQQGIDYIGKAIDADGNKGMLVNKNAVFLYELPTNAHKVDITILDRMGRPVFSGPGATGSGKNLVRWDGKDGETRAQLPDGTYQIVVKAETFDGTKIDAKTYTTGVVDAVETEKDGTAVLLLGNERIKIGDVRAVRDIGIPTTTQASQQPASPPRT